MECKVKYETTFLGHPSTGNQEIIKHKTQKFKPNMIHNKEEARCSIYDLHPNNQLSPIALESFIQEK